MKKTLGTCIYTCASCNTKFEILSTKNQPLTIDICSGCHPFYIGNSTNTTLRGRVEKLANKFNVQQQTKESKKEIKKKTNKKIGGLEIL